jgi:hypothetical protein
VTKFDLNDFIYFKETKIFFYSISAVSRLDVNKEKKRSHFEGEKKFTKNSFLKFETDFTKCHQLSQIFIYFLVEKIEICFTKPLCDFLIFLIF